MAISGDTLYVADISVVRRFEAKPGKQKDDVKIEGASFLNDVTPDGKDGVYVTDTGVDAAFKPTGTDAVYHVDKDGKVKPVVKAKDLGNPNGVWFDGKNTLWVVTFGSGEIYDVDVAKAKKGKATKLPKGQLDGIVGGLDGGDFLVSSWECKCVYRGKPGGEWKPVVEDVESPADIDYDPKRKRLLIPGFSTNKITVHQL
jgi:sugar lactone lactonase YvrE